MTVAIDWGFDAARLGTIGFTLTETGGGGATGAVALTGRYWHSHDYSDVTTVDPMTGEVEAADVDYGYFPPLLKAALDAIGNATYTVTFNATTGSYTISASGGGVTSFAFTSITTAAKRYLGRNAAVSGALTYSSDVDVWHYTILENGGASQWQEGEADIAGEDLIGADGSTRGLVAVGAARTLDFVAPLEPLATLYHETAFDGDTAWTWHRAFSRCRTIEPFVIDDPRVAGQYVVARLRADSCVLRPRPMAADYLAYQDVPIGAYYIGRII